MNGCEYITRERLDKVAHQGWANVAAADKILYAECAAAKVKGRVCPEKEQLS